MLSCPFCGTGFRFEGRTPRSHNPFQCARCHRWLRVSAAYHFQVQLITIMLTFAAFLPIVLPNLTFGRFMMMYLGEIIIFVLVERIARVILPVGIDSYGPPTLFP